MHLATCERTVKNEHSRLSPHTTSLPVHLFPPLHHHDTLRCDKRPTMAAEAFGSWLRMKRESDCLPVAERRASVIIKDAADVTGSGMAFELKLSDTFGYAFKTFNSSSCEDCRPADEFRFTTSKQRVEGTDTPKKVCSLLHFRPFTSTTTLHRSILTSSSLALCTALKSSSKHVQRSSAWIALPVAQVDFQQHRPSCETPSTPPAGPV